MRYVDDVAFCPLHSRHGLTNGTADQKREAAQCYADLLKLVDGKFVQRVIIKITGPLIRILGDRYLTQVRSAVLDALVLLLDKGGRLLKPFVPQMQTSLVKNLKDPNSGVRATALKALKRLLKFSPRIDPLVREVCTSVGVSHWTGTRYPVPSAVRPAFRLLRFLVPSVSFTYMSMFFFLSFESGVWCVLRFLLSCCLLHALREWK